MTVKQTELVNGQPAADLHAPKGRRKAQIGLVSGESIERALAGTIYLGALTLALLSLFGTFYGLQGKDAPLAQPWMMFVDAAASPAWLGGAFVLQFVLTVAQWGARQFAKRAPRWWLLYLAVLGLSVYYNVEAYFDPAVALGVPWLVALLLIIGGDAAPEFAVVRD